MSEFKISPEIIKKATEQRILQDAGFPTMPEAPPEIPVVRAPYQIPLPAPVNPLRTPVTVDSIGEQAVKDSMRQNVVRHGSIYHPDAAPRPTKPETGSADTPSPSPAPTAPSPSTGRNDSAPDGSGAKGTNTGFKGYEIDLDKANSLLGRRGLGQMANANDFLSEQLPVSASEKGVAPEESLVMSDKDFTSAIMSEGNEKYYTGYDFKADPSVAGLRAHAKSLGFDDTKVVEGVSVAGQGEKPGTSPTDTADNNRAISVPGEQEAKTKRRPIRGAVDSRFDDGAEYGESYSVKRTPGREAFRSNFLAGDVDSLTALRNAERSVGKFVQGGNVYANDNGTLVQITKEAGDKMNTGTLTAQEFKDSRVEDVKSTLVPVNTPDSSNPNDDSEGKPGNAVDKIQHEFQGDEFQYNNDPPVGEDGVVDKWAAGMKDRYFGKYDEKGSQGNPQGGTQGRVPLNAG